MADDSSFGPKQGGGDSVKNTLNRTLVKSV